MRDQSSLKPRRNLTVARTAFNLYTEGSAETTAKQQNTLSISAEKVSDHILLHEFFPQCLAQGCWTPLHHDTGRLER